MTTAVIGKRKKSWQEMSQSERDKVNRRQGMMIVFILGIIGGICFIAMEALSGLWPPQPYDGPMPNEALPSAVIAGDLVCPQDPWFASRTEILLRAQPSWSSPVVVRLGSGNYLRLTDRVSKENKTSGRRDDWYKIDETLLPAGNYPAELWMIDTSDWGSSVTTMSCVPRATYSAWAARQDRVVNK